MRDEKESEAHTAAAEAGEVPDRERAFLVVYQGDGTVRTRVLELPDGVEVTFGRSRGATVLVDDDRASRLHARVTRRGTSILIEDLGSRNGTRVNGRRIEGPTRLASGDEFAVGPVTGVLGLTTRLRERLRIGSAADLEDRLAAEADRAGRTRRPFSLLMLRLEGPSAAVEAALDRMASALRRMDSLSEYGPDEYAILVPETDAAAAGEIAGRLVLAARGGAGGRAPVGACAGLAASPEDGREPGRLLSRARAALRAARAGGAGPGGVARAGGEKAPAAGELIVADPQMERVLALAHRVADRPTTVLILGETGVGKEVIAEEIHRRSGRAARPLVKLSCAALPETLLESELFGHERGAFTGAERRKVGFFEAADGGTIFLDEIGEMSAGVQTRLLRVLEARTITRVGGTAEVPVDVRVICATHRHLEEEVERGTFRQDLYFRISTFTLVVPPLRDRRPQIRPLAEHFARIFAAELGQPPPRLSTAAVAALEAWSWPGNVRELRNAVERAVVLQAGGEVDLEDLPERIRDAAEGGAGVPQADAGPGADIRGRIASVERAALVAALEESDGNQTRAARRLGLSRRALIYKLEKYGLKPPPGGGRQGAL